MRVTKKIVCFECRGRQIVEYFSLTGKTVTKKCRVCTGKGTILRKENL
jgi:hypothetical protein